MAMKFALVCVKPYRKLLGLILPFRLFVGPEEFSDKE